MITIFTYLYETKIPTANFSLKQLVLNFPSCDPLKCNDLTEETFELKIANLGYTFDGKQKCNLMMIPFSISTEWKVKDHMFDVWVIGITML